MSDMPPNSGPEGDPPPAKTRTWVRVLLIGSLTVNLLIVGLLVGAVLTRDGPRGSEPRLRDAGLGPLTWILSDPERQGLRKELKTRAPDFRKNREVMRQTVGQLLETIRSEDFDPAAVEAILSQQRLSLIHI